MGVEITVRTSGIKPPKGNKDSRGCPRRMWMFRILTKDDHGNRFSLGTRKAVRYYTSLGKVKQAIANLPTLYQRDANGQAILDHNGHPIRLTAPYEVFECGTAWIEVDDV